MVGYFHARRLHRAAKRASWLVPVLSVLILLLLTTNLALLAFYFTSGPEDASATTTAAEAQAAMAEVAASPVATAMPPAAPVLLPSTATAVEVKVGPTSKYVTVGILPQGSKLDVLGRDDSGKWLAIAFPAHSSFTGWIPVSQVSNLHSVMGLKVVPVTPLPQR